MSNRALPPIGWFRSFESAARLLSFTAAASELGLTQSAVSQQIRSLEIRFGCALFVRKSRGIALTDEGRRLLPQVSDGINNLTAASAAFEPAADPKLLTIATSVSVAQWFLVPRLNTFVEKNNDVRIRIQTTVWPDEFVASTADVQIRFGPIDSTSESSKPLGSNQMTLVASPDLIEPPLKRKFAHSLAELSDHPLIQVVGTTDTWQRFSDAIGEPSEKQASIFVDSHGMLVDFAKSGSGVALVSALISAPCIASGALIQLHPTLIPAKDGYTVETTSGNNHAIAKKFTSWIRKEARAAENLAFG